MQASSPRRARTASIVSLAAALVAALTVLTGAAATAASSDTDAAAQARKAQLQTFGIGPSSKDGLDRRGAFVYAGRPGTVIKDQVALVNYTTKPRKVRLYAADAFTTDEGVFDVLADGAPSTDLASWINLKPRTVTIPPRASATAQQPGTRIVPFTVRVPANAAPGDHAAGFVASVRTDPAKGTSSVVVDRRVGTRVYLQVPGALDPRLEVSGLTASYSGTLDPVGTGTTRVTYVVRNAGNVVLSARQSVAVDTWFGTARPSAAQPDLVQLLPGAEVSVSVDVPGTWPTLRPTAVVTLVPYTGTAEAPTALDPVTASTSFWAIPWTLLAAIVIALLLALALRWWSRRRATRRAATLERAPADLVETS